MTLWVFAADAASISPEEAASHVGETATVCGVVASATYAACVLEVPSHLIVCTFSIARFHQLEKGFVLSRRRDQVAMGGELRQTVYTSLIAEAANDFDEPTIAKGRQQAQMELAVGLEKTD